MSGASRLARRVGSGLRRGLGTRFVLLAPVGVGVAANDRADRLRDLHVGPAEHAPAHRHRCIFDNRVTLRIGRFDEKVGHGVTGLSQRLLVGSSTAKKRNCSQTNFLCSLDIKPRITDRNRPIGCQIEFTQRRFEHVRRRFGFLYVVGRSCEVHEVGDASDVKK